MCDWTTMENNLSFILSVIIFFDIETASILKLQWHS